MRPARGGTLRAWAELLRAPLLLSPAADVLAGWSVAAARMARTDSLDYCAEPAQFADILREALIPLGVAAMTGTLLLAGGMILNGVVDVAEDRQRKPHRPLARGEIALPAAATAAASCLVLALLLAWQALPAALSTVAWMSGLIVAYHVGLKRLRLPGCAALGAIRGLDVWLGAVALRSVSDAHVADIALINYDPIHGTTAIPKVYVYAYSMYMFGASLFASTDDEPGEATWSAPGLLLAILGLLSLLPTLIFASQAATLAALLVVAAALWRIIRSAHDRPRPATTGVLLSGLYFFQAAACFSVGWGTLSVAAGSACLLLFLASRLLLRTFPPT